MRIANPLSALFGTAGRPTGYELDQALDTLAAAVHAHWRQASRAPRWDGEPAVRWRVPRSAPDDAAQEAAQGEGVRAQDDVLLDAFLSLPRGRLLITGGPGSGKSTLATSLLVHLLERRGPDDRVPVLLPAASWDPLTESPQNWLARQLGELYPAVAVEAGDLVAHKRVLPMLDGLDELDPALRSVAVQALSVSLDPSDPVVITCRSGEIEPEQLNLAHFAVVEVLPISAEDAAAYVERALSPPDAPDRSPRELSPNWAPRELSPSDTPNWASRELSASDAAGWAPLLENLRAQPQGPLAQALDNPLTLRLLRDTYLEPGRDPGELLDTARFPSSTAIAEHLLDNLLVDLLPPRPDAPAVPWRPGHARRWLEFLAGKLSATHAVGLNWWGLAGAAFGGWMQAVPRLAGVVAVTVLAAFGSPGLWILAVLITLVLAQWNVPRLTSRRPLDPAALARRTVVRVATLVPAGALCGAAQGFFQDRAAIGGLSAAGAAFAVPWALAWALLDCLLVSQRQHPVETPRGSLRADERMTLLAASADAVAAGLLAVPVAWATGDWSAPLLGALVVGVLRASVGRSTAYHVARVILAVRGRLPFRLMAFLDDLYRADVLRRVGASYQFRHPQFQDRLQATHLARSREARAAARDAPLGDRRVHGEIVDETLFLPEMRARIGLDQDGERRRALREVAMEVLATSLAAVGDAGAEHFGRYRQALDRLRQAAEPPLWARPGRLYGFAVWLLPVCALWAAGLLWGYSTRSFLMFLVLASALPLAQAEAVRALAHRSGRRGERRFTPSPWSLPVAYTVAAVSLAAAVATTPALVVVHGTATGALVPVAGTTLVNAIIVMGIAWPLLLAAWLLTRPHRALYVALSSNNPKDWEMTPPGARRLRTAAEQARRDWIETAARDGLMPLLRRRLDPVRNADDDVLPDIDRAQLGDVSRLDQLVDTRVNTELQELFKHRVSASIGISGTRGAGKSTLLRRWCTPYFGSPGEDLRLLEQAPTAYDRQEFLIHLFARVCERVVGDQSPEEPGRRPLRRRMAGLLPLAATVTGLAAVVGGAAWQAIGPSLGSMVSAALAAPATLVIAAGAVVLAGGLVGAARTGRLRRAEPGVGVEQVAAAHLRTLRWRRALTRTRDGRLTVPGGSLTAGSAMAEQRTEAARTYPQLVADFRELLDLIALERRAAGGRVIIGIDELDKIGTAEDAERFLNDLKAVFGVPGCYFMVALSDDALLTFERRSLAVRNTFDSAFDKIFAVRPLNVAESALLLQQRGVPLPDRFVWLCHALSGGLPRDLLRRVDDLAAARSSLGLTRLPDLAAELIRQDLATVLGAQLRTIAAVATSEAAGLTMWLAAHADAGGTADGLEKLAGAGPVTTEEACRALVAQTRAYLYYCATLLRIFADGDAVARQWLEACRDRPHLVDRLSTARALLAGDPTLAWQLVDRLRGEAPGLQPIPAGNGTGAGVVGSGE
ncbi:NACHT domain-containing protein [Nonomuraea sp. NN258]|uniref:NACHT domain-containing protein n=1 Tax=Nonomuraea antri TaxID=2730852 RepID=UPI0015691D0F|nr:NACHT domain-containing protein [Nonomuraea antri]NRQ37168.1 NACHT domain-containing protein [Nonomuraea antri]